MLGSPGYVTFLHIIAPKVPFLHRDIVCEYINQQLSLSFLWESQFINKEHWLLFRAAVQLIGGKVIKVNMA